MAFERVERARCDAHRAHAVAFQIVETFTLDHKAFVAEEKNAPEGKGTMVALYGGFLSFARATPYASLTLY